MEADLKSRQETVQRLKLRQKKLSNADEERFRKAEMKRNKAAE